MFTFKSDVNQFSLLLSFLIIKIKIDLNSSFLSSKGNKNVGAVNCQYREKDGNTKETKERESTKMEKEKTKER